MRQVESNKYNKEYYTKNYGSSSLLKNNECFDAMHNLIYQEIANIAGVQPDDRVVDYGCGNGDLAFYLASKYHCNIKAIDYSKEAIDICNKKLKQVKDSLGTQISFINADSKNLPDFNDIKAVFFCDVLEHMYDEEIEIVLEHVKNWGIDNKAKIIAHTDNEKYLKFIGPLFGLLDILLSNKSLDQIRKEKRTEKELHINLTTPKKLRKKMKKWGYKQTALKYPTPVDTRIKRQLGKLQNIPYLFNICVFMLKKFAFLSPSFYAVYEISD